MCARVSVIVWSGFVYDESECGAATAVGDGEQVDAFGQVVDWQGGGVEAQCAQGASQQVGEDGLGRQLCSSAGLSASLSFLQIAF